MSTATGTEFCELDSMFVLKLSWSWAKAGNAPCGQDQGRKTAKQQLFLFISHTFFLSLINGIPVQYFRYSSAMR